jgi:2-hydroxy-3-keto-5-methylthiopentenyl-1-phosphate phosphatase
MLRVFCDFDGTLSPIDVGNQLFRTFAGEKAVEIVKGYLDGSVTARECLQRECAAVPDLDPERFRAFVDAVRLDPTASGFFAFCAEHEIPVTILSDGLDLYVEQILHNNGFGELPFFANHGTLVPEGGRTRLDVAFPWTDAECTLCGNCKRNHMLTLSGDDDVVIYIGDGMSDRCPVQFADVVFAKGSLIGFCQERNITYQEFRNFDDVRARLELLLGKKRIRKRREASMARRDVYLQG